MRNSRVTVTLSRRMMLDLHRLHQSGLYGRSPSKVAQYLIMRQIQDLLAVKILPFEYDAEEMGRLLERAQRNNRNTRRMSIMPKITEDSDA